MLAALQFPASRRPDEHATLAAARGEIWTMMRIGGFDEALVRSLIFVLDFEADCDEQALRALRRLQGRRPDLDAARLSRMVHEQAAVLRLDRTIAIESLPALLPDDDDGAERLLESIGSLLRGAARDRDVAQRFQQLARIVSFA
ncbi:MAG TPA: hypothetical protein PK177_09635 [Burkholderiaceae bacterium]|nr:hypothetical protein [Burkholderiaceae bacterium]